MGAAAATAAVSLHAIPEWGNALGSTAAGRHAYGWQCVHAGARKQSKPEPESWWAVFVGLSWVWLLLELFGGWRSGVGMTMGDLWLMLGSSILWGYVVKGESNSWSFLANTHGRYSQSRILGYVSSGYLSFSDWTHVILSLSSLDALVVISMGTELRKRVLCRFICLSLFILSPLPLCIRS